VWLCGIPGFGRGSSTSQFDECAFDVRKRDPDGLVWDTLIVQYEPGMV
jgi:hypothetical protein